MRDEISSLSLSVVILGLSCLFSFSVSVPCIHSQPLCLHSRSLTSFSPVPVSSLGCSSIICSSVAWCSLAWCSLVLSSVACPFLTCPSLDFVIIFRNIISREQPAGGGEFLLKSRGFLSFEKNEIWVKNTGGGFQKKILLMFAIQFPRSHEKKGGK